MVWSAVLGLIYVALGIYAVLDCLQAPSETLGRFGRGSWIVVILLLPLAGAISWMLASRTGQGGRHARAPEGPNRPDGYGWTSEGVAQHPRGPDDDPEFLAQLGRAQRRRDGHDPQI